MVTHEWILKRNCSISPRQLAIAYVGLCMVSLAIAMFFTFHGAWYVLSFSILEMFAVALAFLHFGRHATDRERIALVDGYLIVELIQAEKARQFRLDPQWTRVEPPASSSGLIALKARGVHVEVGRFLTELKRHEFARELSRSLV